MPRWSPLQRKVPFGTQICSISTSQDNVDQKQEKEIPFDFVQAFKVCHKLGQVRPLMRQILSGILSQSFRDRDETYIPVAFTLHPFKGLGYTLANCPVL
jgi:hypothetical protein